jgi:hypothetical protein
MLFHLPKKTTEFFKSCSKKMKGTEFFQLRKSKKRLIEKKRPSQKFFISFIQYGDIIINSRVMPIASHQHFHNAENTVK